MLAIEQGSSIGGLKGFRSVEGLLESFYCWECSEQISGRKYGLEVEIMKAFQLSVRTGSVV